MFILSQKKSTELVKIVYMGIYILLYPVIIRVLLQMTIFAHNITECGFWVLCLNYLSSIYFFAWYFGKKEYVCHIYVVTLDVTGKNIWALVSFVYVKFFYVSYILGL